MTTFYDLRCELATYIECYMDDYLEPLSLEELKQYYPDGYEEDFIVDDTTLLKFLNASSFEEIIDDIQDISYDDDINEIIDFDWDGYCLYYHSVIVRNAKLDSILN